MKLSSLFATLLLPFLSVFALGLEIAQASQEQAHVEIWVGSGAEYTPQGEELETYEITVINSFGADNKVHSEATITTARGGKRVITQDLTIKGNRWSNISNLGKGGGACYGADMCENYLEDESGRAYATTIAIDSRDQRRNLTMILQNGKAIKVVREKVSRAQ